VTQPGEIVLEHAFRSFSVRADRGRTLKELVLRGGPPPVRALHDVSLRVRPGETVGLVGRKWALIEPDVDLVYSTRRFGRPITAFKRALVWSLGQYNGQVYGQQTRFNHHIVLYARRREDRIAELEQQVAALEREKGRGDEA
jgi:hypothetical protein